MNDWVLHLSIFLPVAGAVAVACIPQRHENAHRWVALGVSAVVFALGVYLLAAFDYDNAGTPQFETKVNWISVLNSNYHVFVDGISLPLMVLSMLITTLCVVYSWSHFPQPRNPRAFLALMLLLETGVNGAFAAQDLLLFFVFFEIVLLPMYFMVGIWGGPRRQYAALKFFVYTVLGSAFMLLAFLALYFYGGHTFDIPELASASSPVRDVVHSTQLLIFGGLFIGFAIKVPLFPFHTWMPDAHTEAPTVASVLLAAVLLKLGAYGFIRIALPILPEAAHSYAPWIGLLASIGIIYGALGCLAQRDMKRLIAFSSLAHMGFVMLAVATLTDYGLNAALFAMVAHGFITGMLFFLSGSIQQRLHTRDLNSFGGLLAVAPHLTWILGFCAMASLGLPGLAGFWGEFASILSAFNPADGLSVTTFRTYMVIAAVGTVLGAGYLLWMYQRVAFGPPSETVASREVHDATTSEYLAWAPLIVLIFLLGVVPSLLFDITSPAVDDLLHRMGQ
jgi:NADH-quinone oxidoreductase subunit M